MFTSFILALCTYLKRSVGMNIDMDSVILINLVLMIVVYSHMVYWVSEELCEFLGIKRFTIPYPNPALNPQTPAPQNTHKPEKPKSKIIYT